MEKNKLKLKLKLKSKRTSRTQQSVDAVHVPRIKISRKIKKFKEKNIVYHYSMLKSEQRKTIKKMIKRKIKSNTIISKINNFKRANKIAKVKRFVKKPGALISLYHQIEAEAKNYKPKSVISQRYKDLLKKYTAALNASVKSKAIRERNKGILKAKLERFAAYKKAGAKLYKSQVFPSYFTNKTQKIFDKLAYLSIYYPNEINEMKNRGISEMNIVDTL